ncbi:hypothetical protein pb186bvf_010572 [Paramecium bursaria]
MKDFAKDLITVEETDDQNNFQNAFQQIEQQYKISSSNQSPSPIKESEPIQQVIDIIGPYKQAMINLYNQYNEQIDRDQSFQQYIEQDNQIVKDAIQEIQKLFDEQQQKYVKLEEQFIKIQVQIAEDNQEFIYDVASLINNFFTSIQRSSSFYEKVLSIKQQKGPTKDLLQLIERSLYNTAVEIQQQKEQQAQKQSLSSENIQLQKKLVEYQDKLQNQQSIQKDLQSKIKELEKYTNEFDKIKRDFVEEIKQNYAEIEQLNKKIKIKETEIQQNSAEVQKALEITAMIDQKDDEIQRLSILLEEWQQENQQLQSGIQQIQIQLDSEKENKKILERRYEQELKKIKQEKEDIIQLKQIKDLYDKIKDKNAQNQLIIEEQLQQIDSLKLQLKDLQNENQALHHRIKQDQSYQSNLVDRRIVTNFLIQFLDQNTDFGVKQQIIETLASLLHLTPQERDKISIFKHQQALVKSNNTSNQPTKQSLSDKFIGFLVQDQK